MARLQLALNVSDLDQAIDFYAKLFATRPAKLRPGYANFAISDPPLKLVLIESAEAREPGVMGALNHLGVEVEAPSEVQHASGRLSSKGLETTDERGTTCCYAVQDKVWVADPDGSPWEIYTVLADAPVESGIEGDSSCCASSEEPDPVTSRAVATSACSCC
jgi:catechol 2,3-dioxygenase-like lactoylglutathione lyase family enzyme